MKEEDIANMIKLDMKKGTVDTPKLTFNQRVTNLEIHNTRTVTRLQAEVGVLEQSVRMLESNIAHLESELKKGKGLDINAVAALIRALRD